MGPFVILLFLAVPTILTARLVVLLADPEASWIRCGYRFVVRSLQSLRSYDPRVPLGRPIEDIARDVRRLGQRLRHADDGRSGARIHALQRAYDAALGEGCAALGYTHLLSVLPPGPDQDTERARVESLLSRAGLVLEETS